MKLNRIELKKIMYDFNSISSRLLQANYEDYTRVLNIFIEFVKNNELISAYISDCSDSEQNIEQEFERVESSFGRYTFSLGTSNEEEVRDVYAILRYIVDNNIHIHNGLALGYSHSKYYQDKVKGFNDRITMVLIRHIENYLTKIGIDMGLDEKITYSITVENGQVNIANDDATIIATNNGTNIDMVKFSELIQDIKKTAVNLSESETEAVSDSLEVIQEEVKSSNPRKSFLKTAITCINGIKGSAEFAAAIATLVQFLKPIL